MRTLQTDRQRVRWRNRHRQFCAAHIAWRCVNARISLPRGMTWKGKGGVVFGMETGRGTIGRSGVRFSWVGIAWTMVAQENSLMDVEQHQCSKAYVTNGQPLVAWLPAFLKGPSLPSLTATYHTFGGKGKMQEEGHYTFCHTLQAQAEKLTTDERARYLCMLAKTIRRLRNEMAAAKKTGKRRLAKWRNRHGGRRQGIENGGHAGVVSSAGDKKPSTWCAR